MTSSIDVPANDRIKRFIRNIASCLAFLQCFDSTASPLGLAECMSDGFLSAPLISAMLRYFQMKLVFFFNANDIISYSKLAALLHHGVLDKKDTASLPRVRCPIEYVVGFKCLRLFHPLLLHFLWVDLSALCRQFSSWRYFFPFSYDATYLTPMAFNELQSLFVPPKSGISGMNGMKGLEKDKLKLLHADQRAFFFAHLEYFYVYWVSFAKTLSTSMTEEIVEEDSSLKSEVAMVVGSDERHRFLKLFWENVLVELRPEFVLSFVRAKKMAVELWTPYSAQLSLQYRKIDERLVDLQKDYFHIVADNSTSIAALSKLREMGTDGIATLQAYNRQLLELERSWTKLERSASQTHDSLRDLGFALETSMVKTDRLKKKAEKLKFGSSETSLLLFVLQIVVHSIAFTVFVIAKSLDLCYKVFKGSKNPSTAFQELSKSLNDSSNSISNSSTIPSTDDITNNIEK